MTAKADFTPEEWEQLLEAPLNAGLYISMASPSVLGSIGESMSIAKTIAASVSQAAGNEVLTAMLGDFQNKETAKAAKPEYQTKDPAQMKQAVTDSLSGAVATLNKKATPEESQGVREWFYQVAMNTATATKEGGFLGIGAVRVSDSEKAALQELAGTLGVEAKMPAE